MDSSGGCCLQVTVSGWGGGDVSPAHEVLLSFTRSAVIAALLLGGIPAFAQEDEPESERSEGVEDIYVTAERRESRLQETPVAVSVFTGADLDQKGYLDFEDVSFQVPNVQYGRDLVGSGGFTIRGISSSVGDRSTSFHFDGIYANRGSAVEGVTFFDIQRVEVLRGPQGTLYGRNSTGGAINVISTPPGPDFEAFGDVQFGSYNQVLWRAALNLPIHSERLFARVSLFGDQRDGYQKNITEKQTITWDGSPVKKKDADDSSTFGVRNQLRWLPTDNLDLTLRYNYAQRTGVGGAQKTLGDYPAFVTFPTPFGVDLDVDQYCQSGAARDSGCIVTDNPADNRKIVLDLIGDADAWSHTVNGQVVWDLPETWAGETQFKGLFSYYTSRSYGLSDQDGSDADLVRAFTTVNTSYEVDSDGLLEVVSGCDPAAYSAGETAEEAGCRRGHNELAETVLEAQWSSAGGGDLDWVLGAFFLNTKSFNNGVVTTKPAPWINGEIAGTALEDSANDLQVPVLTTTRGRARSLAAFGQLDYRLGQDSDTFWDDWTATLGLRYTYDWKKVVRDTPKISPILVLPVFGPIEVPIQAQIVAADSDNWNSVTGTARLKWDWSDENHLYFSGSRGFKSGVIVTALKNSTDPDSSFDNADPEHIWAAEVGSKNRFWDNRVQANLTGFYYWYEALQISQLAEASVITQNATDADVWGLEAELIVKPLEGFVPELFEGLTLLTNAGYLDATYGDFEDCFLGEAERNIDCTGNTLTRAPPYTVTVIANWPFDFGRFGTLTPNAQFHASGKVQFRPSNCPNPECEAALALQFPEGRAQNIDHQKPYEIWDARLTWTSADQHVEVSGFVNNIADKDVIQSQVVGSSLLGAPIQVRFDRPRTWGVRVGLSW